MSIVLGVDPGKAGAAVGAYIPTPEAFDLGLRRNPLVFRTSDYLVKIGGRGKAKSDYDEHQFAAILRGMGAGFIELAVIESQSARPGQGVVSMLSIGRGEGIWRGVLAGLGIRTVLVAPQTWMAAVLKGAPGEGKARARAVARRLFPELSIPRGKAGDGVADAACIAEYALRLIGRKENRHGSSS